MSVPTSPNRGAIAGLAGLIDQKVGEIANEKNRREEFLLSLTGSVASAFVAGGRVQAGELPQLIASIHESFAQLGGRGMAPAPRPRSRGRRSTRRNRSMTTSSCAWRTG